jgi:hypothetical protein
MESNDKTIIKVEERFEEFIIKLMKKTMQKLYIIMSLLQNSVSFAQALAVFRPMAYQTAFFSGCCCETEVLQQPLITKELNDLKNECEK